MPDAPQDTQAHRRPDGTPGHDGSADTSQEGPTERPGAADEASEPMTNEPLPVADDGPGVGLSSPEETIDGNRGM